MKPLRFLKKCFTNPPAALSSAKLVFRSFYGKIFWTLRPDEPIVWPLSKGIKIKLLPKHSFTQCIWPDIEGYEPDVCWVLKNYLKPGGVFLDCGANVGFFSLLAHAQVGETGRVIAIEANPETFKLLNENLSENRFGTGVACALTSNPGPVTLYFPKSKGDIYSSLKTGGLFAGMDAECVTVEGRKLEEIVKSLELNRIDVIKIDIEGGELDVLRSGKELLCKFKPIVICEYGSYTWPSFGATASQLLDVLAEYDYKAKIFSIKDGFIDAVDEDWKRPYVNLVLLPRNFVI